jgi:hypothetical protein
MSTLQDATTFVEHLRSGDKSFRVLRGESGPRWDDADQHQAAWERDPELYALSAVADRVRPAQRARVLFQVLDRTWAGLPEAVRVTLERVAGWLATVLPADDAVSVFLAVRRSRANHKHASRLLLRWLLNHPALEELAARRRRALVDCLEHAMGRNVARACARLLDGADASPYLRRYLLRFADDVERMAAVVRFLYRRAVLPAVPAGCPALDEVTPRADAEPAAERLKTVTATNRGDVAATLVHIYRGGATEELRRALDCYVEDAAATLPHYDGTVALVLDASASTQGYGERAFACISQSQALCLVLERCCANLRVYTVGGSGDPPRPEGATNLAGTLLDALEGNPDLVAVVSDGYENDGAGDLARVVATLPAAGVRTPVVFCHSKFTAKDDLTLRRPAPALPELEFWHEEDFAEVLWSLFAGAGGRGTDYLRSQLRRRLALLEKETRPWTSRPS